MNDKSNIQPKCKYCSVLLVKDKETCKLPWGEKGKVGINVNYGKVAEAYTCPKCGYTELFTIE